MISIRSSVRAWTVARSTRRSGQLKNRIAAAFIRRSTPKLIEGRRGYFLTRLAALATALSEAVTMLASMPTP